MLSPAVEASRIGRRAAATLLLWAVGCGCVHALPPELSLAQLHHKRWTLEDGAPSNIYAITQTTDGALWLGSQNGLFRFDGLRFHRFQGDASRTVSHGDISALLAMPDGSLWIGHRSGRAFLWTDGQLRSVDEGLRTGSSLLQLLRLPDGRVLTAQPQGLFVHEDGKWKGYGPPASDAASTPNGGYVRGLALDSKGRVWVAGIRGVFSHNPAGAEFKLESTSDSCGLGLTPDGRAWCSHDARQRLGVIDADADGSDPPGQLVAQVWAGAIMGDRQGGLWLAQTEGIARLPDPVRNLGARGVSPIGEVAQTFTPAQGLSGNAVRTFFEDRDGSVWVGTNGGLDRFRAPRLTRVPAAHIDDATMLPGNDGGVIACGLRFGVVTLSDNVIRNQGTASDCIALHRAADGTVWAGGLFGIRRLEGAQSVEVPLPDEKPRFVRVNSISSDSEGALWVVAVPRGAYRLKAGNWQFVPVPRWAPHSPQHVVGDPKRGVWLGFLRNRIAFVDGAQIKTFDADSGLQIGNVQVMLPSAVGLLVGGSTGLGLLRDTGFLPLRGPGDEAFSGTSGLVFDGEGSLWINCTHGVLRVNATELERAIDQPGFPMAFERFDHRDGLLGEATQSPWPTAMAHPDGKLWFSTAGGLVTIDPRRISHNPIPPTAEVLGLRVDGQPVPLAGELRLAQGTSRLEIDYTAYSLSIPDRVHFRYRLSGVDDEWRDAGSDRVATYTSMRPGHYRFELLAANEDGVWNKQPTELHFSITPAFWQTAWFSAFCMGAALVALWGLYRLRLRQLTSRLRLRAEAQAQERERIARDLHDTLLQSTQGLMLSIQVIADKTPDGHPDKAHLERALERADQAIQEGRTKVLELRDDHLGSDLAELLGDLASELGGRGPAVVSLRTEGEARPLSAAVRSEALRIGQEALINAQRHARARHIEALLLYGQDSFKLRVSDDGIGMSDTLMDGSQTRPAHFGLAGLRERAANAGGALTIRRGEAGGTVVELKVPGARAYATPAR